MKLNLNPTDKDVVKAALYALIVRNFGTKSVSEQRKSKAAERLLLSLLKDGGK